MTLLRLVGSRERSAAAALPAAVTPARRDRVGLAGLVAVGVLTLLLAGMLGRVAQLQLAPTAALSAHIDQRLTTVREPGVRGDILDRRGRLLAASRFGHRVFVDPLRFPNPPGDAMVRLSDLTGVPVEEIAERIVGAMTVNEQRAAGAAARAAQGRASPLAVLAGVFAGGRGDADAGTEGGDGAAPRLIRYVSVGGVLDDWRVEHVRAARIPGVHLELRAVREQPAPELTSSLVGAVGVDHDGLLGAERMLDALVKPQSGRLRYVRDARSRPLWVEQGGYVAPERGHDVRLSIDLELQRIAREELERAVAECDAAGARLVLMDPQTGEILALLDLVRQPPEAVEFDWAFHDGPRRRYRVVKAEDASKLAHPALARNRCVEDVYEPGSTFKAFMWSQTTALGLADPGESVDTEGGRWVTPYGRGIEDVVRRGVQSWRDVLVNSSNIGMVKITRRMSEKQMHDAVVRFGFGTKTRLGLPGESPGLITPLKHWTKYTHTSVAMGYEVAVTPVQMVRAFSAFARTGELAGTVVEPRLVAAEPGEEAGYGARRVLPAPVAELTRRTMCHVAHNMDERLHKANKDEPPPRYELFGKSGTAKIPLGKPPKGRKRPRGMRGYFDGQYNTSFIAAGPAEKPRLICLVVIDDPGPQLVRENRYYGSHTAGPVVRRVMERALAYVGAPPTYPEGGPVGMAAAGE